MDAFVFDNKFARFVSLVDTADIRQGTYFHESGCVTVLSITKDGIITGSVKPNAQQSYHVKLIATEDGPFSGSCSCPTIFNCSHSYALARTARDQLKGVKQQKSKTPAPASNIDPITAEVERRIQNRIDKASAELIKSLQRLWKICQQSGLSLYTQDILPFLKSRNFPELRSKNLIRELDPIFASNPPKSHLDLADLIRAYGDEKGYSLKDTFKAITLAAQYKKHFSQKGPTNSEKKWDDTPHTIDFKLDFQDVGDGWLNVSAKARIGNGQFSDKETQQLIAANGQLVELLGKGWHRAKEPPCSPISDFFNEIGISPQRGNSQRIHVSQVNELVPDAYLGQECKDIISSSEFDPEIKLPPPPQALAKILRPYQLHGFQFLCHLSLRHFGGILADDMGLGKTLQTLTWLSWLKERHRGEDPFRVLIICPKSVVDNWVTEPYKFPTKLTSSAYFPKSKKQAQQDLTVANYSQLRINSEYFLKKQWDVAILDEGQYIKNPSSQTSKVAFKLNATQRLVLSGTPIENQLKDLWSLMRFAMPRLLGPLPSFQLNYNIDKNPDAASSISKRIQPFLLRRLKNQVAKDLPERIEKEIRCELTPLQKKLYDKELDKLRGTLDQTTDDQSFNQERFSVLSSLMRLRQICCDPRLLKNARITEDEEPSAKVSALLDIVLPLMEEGHKVLVFSQFVSMLEILKNELKKNAIKTHFLSGKTQNRKMLIDDFQNSKEPSAFLLSLKAAGSGLNLTAASYAILFDPWWNPAVEAQAIDRCHRIGQKSKVVAYRILAKDTVEDKIRALQHQKADLANSIIHEDSLQSALDLKTLKSLFVE